MEAGTWWQQLSQHQQQAIYIATSFLVLVWILGGVFLFMYKGSGRRPKSTEGQAAAQAQACPCPTVEKSPVCTIELIFRFP
jgi:hypothetical protein